jgi:phosphoribosyl 1,2-cyclic phosphodiesterase
LIRLASLGSGSRGNGTLIQFDSELFLVDCGFSLKQTEARLARLDVKPGDLSAVLVTHEHSDHISGVAALAHKYALPVYATYGTLNSKAARKGSLIGQMLNAHESVTVGEVSVIPVVVPHDAREPVQFVFQSGERRVGVISDLGHVTPHVIEQYQALDLLLMESNHDPQMLMRGRYPESVKQRIVGRFGHLSNEQAAAFLAEVAHPQLQVVVGHVSEENNHPDLLAETFASFDNAVDQLCFATQEEGADWLSAIDTEGSRYSGQQPTGRYAAGI